jgi:putative ABC transport system permease protein
MIVQPHDVKSEALISGRYQADKELQLFRPIDVLETLLGTLFKVEKLILAALLLVAGAAGAVAVLVFWLSFRMRQKEFATLADIGVSEGTLRLVRAWEVCLVGLGALLVAVTVRVIASGMAHAIFARGLGD